MNFKFRNIFIGIFLAFLVLPFFCFADTQGQKVNFFVDKGYDLLSREQVPASLVLISQKIYFYVEDSYWSSLDGQQQQSALASLNNLSIEIDNKIYPTLTSTFGAEWSPGIDKDVRITVLFEQLRKDAGGYFNNGNEYYKAQYSLSNEREMVYLNAVNINDPQLKAFFAHEFQHLISFNQKERIFGAQEEIWLNEARSEIGISLLGYNDVYQGSNLQRRVQSFLNKSTDSITEWQGTSSDYGVLNIFSQYLLDHYGTDIFAQTMKTRTVGIESINNFLNQKNIAKDFSAIFTDWTIATLINDCSYGDKYCYTDNNLKGLKVVPTTNFLPRSGQSSLQVSKTIKNWAGNWEKFIGGSNDLKLEFTGSKTGNFKVPYIVENLDGVFTINFMNLDFEQKGIISVSNFGSRNVALTILPSLQSKMADFLADDPGLQYSFNASIVGSQVIPQENQAEIQQLLAQIESLKLQIAILVAKLNQQNSGTISCSQFTSNLYYGFRNNAQVKCLQEFLSIKYPNLYPEKLVTGNYFTATQNAVKKYQAQKGISQTGYFGPKTRASMNQELQNIIVTQL